MRSAYCNCLAGLLGIANLLPNCDQLDASRATRGYESRKTGPKSGSRTRTPILDLEGHMSSFPKRRAVTGITFERDVDPDSTDCGQPHRPPLGQDWSLLEITHLLLPLHLDLINAAQAGQVIFQELENLVFCFVLIRLSPFCAKSHYTFITHGGSSRFGIRRALASVFKCFVHWDGIKILGLNSKPSTTLAWGLTVE